MTRTKLALALIAAVALTGCGKAAVPTSAPAARAAATGARFTPGELNLKPNESIRYMAFFQGTVKGVEPAGEGRTVVTVETAKVDAERDFYTGTLKLNVFGTEELKVAKVGATIAGQAHYPIVNTKTNTWVNNPRHFAQGIGFEAVR